MKAIIMTAPGGPEQLQLEDIAEPEISSPHEVVIEIRAAGVNPIDTKLRVNGVYFPEVSRHVLGCDGAGVVKETGANCTRFQPGDEVYYFNAGLGGTTGNYAEMAVVDERYVARKPDNLSFEESAAAPLALITAWESLFDRGTLYAGDEILIHAGAGGVGHLAIQLAATVDARICTTVGSKEKAEFVKSLGADHAILYKEEDFVTAVQQWSHKDGVNMVFDTVGGETFNKSLRAAGNYGEVITLLQIPEQADWKSARSRNLRITQELMLTPLVSGLHDMRLHQTEILEQCTQLFEAGKLRVHLSHQLPLEKADDAHRMVEEGSTTGKIVLKTG